MTEPEPWPSGCARFVCTIGVTHRDSPPFIDPSRQSGLGHLLDDNRAGANLGGREPEGSRLDLVATDFVGLGSMGSIHETHSLSGIASRRRILPVEPSNRILSPLLRRAVAW